MVLLAPSGSGKTVLLSNLILNPYRGCFEQIYVFSPSVDLDATWEPGKKYQIDVLRADANENETLCDRYDPDELERINNEHN